MFTQGKQINTNTSLDRVEKKGKRFFFHRNKTNI